MTDDLVLEPASSNEELRTVYYGGIPAPSGVYFLSARGAERGESAAVRFVLLRR